jgi:hypothetical protein
MFPGPGAGKRGSHRHPALLSQPCYVAFYIIGFTEASRPLSRPRPAPDGHAIALFIRVSGLSGRGLRMKIQYHILALRPGPALHLHGGWGHGAARSGRSGRSDHPLLGTFAIFFPR